MPHLIQTMTSPSGPVLDVLINVSRPRHDALVKAGVSIPLPIPARLLVDTGASCTVLDKTIIEKLGLVPTGSVPIHTSSTGSIGHSCNQFDVSLVIIGASGGAIYSNSSLAIVESDFSTHGIHGLLGRDLLQKAILTYHGFAEIFTLSF